MLANLIEGVDGYLPITVSLLAENQLPRLIPLALLEIYLISGSITARFLTLHSESPAVRLPLLGSMLNHNLHILFVFANLSPAADEARRQFLQSRPGPSTKVELRNFAH